MTPAPDVRERVLSLLRRFGWNSTSFQVLEPGFSYWFSDDACVAYVDTGRAWVAAGVPLAHESELGGVARAFVASARENGRRALFFATEGRFHGARGFDSLLIGEQPLWDPRDWSKTLETVPSLREQLRRARAKGVTVRRAAAEAVADPASPDRKGLEKLIERWTGTKPMPPMGFLVRVYPFSFPEERRVFLAERAGTLVGFAGVVPIYARNGRFVEDLVRSPAAPNGTVELLIDAAMRDAQAEGADYVTLGLAPLAGGVSFGLRLAGRYGSSLYDFAGLHAFKAKLRPRAWVPVYLSYPSERTSHGAIYDSLTAFARGGILRFGVETLLRGPVVVVRLLALLLVPWTLLLATANGERWFPAPWVQWFWVTFDAAVCIALLALSVRFRPWLATLLLVLVTGDAIATLVEAATLNALGERTLGELGVVFVAILGPVLASVVLFNARRRMLRAED